MFANPPGILFRRFSLGQRKCEQTVVSRQKQVLAAVKLVCDGRIVHHAAKVRMPKRAAISGIQRQRVSRVVAGEQELSRRSQHSHKSASLPDIVGPANFPGPVIDGFNELARP